MIILGIDPGSQFCGYGLIKTLSLTQSQYIDSGVIKLTGQSQVKLNFLHQQISEIRQQYFIDVVVCEKAFVYLNPHSTMKLSEARGVAIMAATADESDFYEYSPNTIKKTVVGNGHANKDQVQFMVKQILKIKSDLQTDASDALACALCHAKHQLQNSFTQRLKQAKLKKS